MKRTLVAVALATVFVLALAMPAFAQLGVSTFSSMSYEASYEWDGNARVFDRLAWTHAGEYSHEIVGEGKMTKNTTIDMVAYKMTVEDNNVFVTAPDAVVNLRVSSKIDLSSPGLYSYLGYMVLPSALYGVYGTPGLTILPGIVAGGELFDTNYLLEDAGATANHRQRWAVQVEPDPGYSGALTQDFEVANGPYIGTSAVAMEAMDFFRGSNVTPVLSNLGWEWTPGVPATNTRHYTSYGAFVGNYFSIDQFARTSMGDLRRYINIGSPWSQTYLYEDFRVVGKSEITETFDMMNIPPGAWPPLPAAPVGVWHDAFI